MPKKKETFDDSEELQLPASNIQAVLDDENAPRSLEFFSMVDQFSRSTYYRLQYEIRPHPNKKMSVREWRKLLEKVRQDDN